MLYAGKRRWRIRNRYGFMIRKIASSRTGETPGQHLNVTDAYTLPEGGDHIGTLRHKLLRDEAFETGVYDGLDHGRVMDFLRLINLTASWHAAGMVMRDIGMMLLDRCDHVSLHNLHVVNVVQQLKPFGADLFGKFNPPRRMIALVIPVIHFAVQ